MTRRAWLLADQGVSSLATFIVGLAPVALGTAGEQGRTAIALVELQIAITITRSFSVTQMYLHWDKDKSGQLQREAFARSAVTSVLFAVSLWLVVQLFPGANPGAVPVAVLPLITMSDTARLLGMQVQRYPRVVCGNTLALLGAVVGTALGTLTSGDLMNLVWSGWALGCLAAVILQGIGAWLPPRSVGAWDFSVVASSLRSASDFLAAPLALLVVFALVTSSSGVEALGPVRYAQTVVAPLTPLIMLVTQQQWRSISRSRLATNDSAELLRRRRWQPVIQLGALASAYVVASSGFFTLRSGPAIGRLILLWGVYVVAIAVEETLLPSLRGQAHDTRLGITRLTIACLQVGTVVATPHRPVWTVLSILAAWQVVGSGLHVWMAQAGMARADRTDA